MVNANKATNVKIRQLRLPAWKTDIPSPFGNLVDPGHVPVVFFLSNNLFDRSPFLKFFDRRLPDLAAMSHRVIRLTCKKRVRKSSLRHLTRTTGPQTPAL